MKTENAALRVALDLLFRPATARLLKDGPLPDGVHEVLEIAAGNEAVIAQAMETTERSASTLRDACRFFIEQMMFHGDADHYRVLGGTAATPIAELRRNMAVLLRWLHPDAGQSPAHAVYVNRVTNAWNAIKTADRRASLVRVPGPSRWDEPLRDDGPAVRVPRSGGKKDRGKALAASGARAEGRLISLLRGLFLRRRPK